jgi:energy-converting hydrogenase A subunit R
MQSGRMLEEVNPVGGFEKADAVEEITKKVNSNLCNVVYFGDSITDIQCFQLIKRNGGLTISFNGNSYAVREAEVAVLSDNTIVTSILADVFNRLDKENVLQMVKEWSYSALSKYSAPQLKKHLMKLYPKTLPQIEVITPSNRERLMKESTIFRKTVRGEVIGALG